MDLMSAAVAVGGPVLTKVLKDVWDDWRNGRNARKGMVVDTSGNMGMLPEVSGVLTVADSDFFYDLDSEQPPIIVTGDFVADTSFVEFADIILDEEDQRVIILIADQETDDVYLYEFGFDGFDLSLWPGIYSFYAFIIDPDLDEVLGIGFPDFGELEDPNPIVISGTGVLEGDIVIFDVDDFE